MTESSNDQLDFHILTTQVACVELRQILFSWVHHVSFCFLKITYHTFRRTKKTETKIHRTLHIWPEFTIAGEYIHLRPSGPPLQVQVYSRITDGLSRPSVFWREGLSHICQQSAGSYETGRSRCWLLSSQTKNGKKFHKLDRNLTNLTEILGTWPKFYKLDQNFTILTKIVWTWPKFYELDWNFMNLTKILRTWPNFTNLNEILWTSLKVHKLDRNFTNLTIFDELDQNLTNLAEIWRPWLKFDKIDQNLTKLTKIWWTW